MEENDDNKFIPSQKDALMTSQRIYEDHQKEYEVSVVSTTFPSSHRHCPQSNKREKLSLSISKLTRRLCRLAPDGSRNFLSWIKTEEHLP